MNALDRIAEKLRKAGAKLPVENKGTIESAMATGLSIALLLVEDEITAAAAEPDGEPLFMCGIDYQHHLHHDSYGTKLYPTIEDLTGDHLSLLSGDDGDGCGIVEVRVQFVRWVKEQAA